MAKKKLAEITNTKIPKIIENDVLLEAVEKYLEMIDVSSDSSSVYNDIKLN